MKEETNVLWTKVIEDYKDIIKPMVEQLKERLISEMPEAGYKSKNDIKPETLRYLKDIKELGDIFGVPVLEQLKSVE